MASAESEKAVARASQQHRQSFPSFNPPEKNQVDTKIDIKTEIEGEEYGRV